MNYNDAKCMHSKDRILNVYLRAAKIVEYYEYEYDIHDERILDILYYELVAIISNNTDVYENVAHSLLVTLLGDDEECDN